MAVTCAVTVANLYYAQPLLHSIGDSLHVGQGSASLLVTAGQLGYAAGLLLIVPAGGRRAGRVAGGLRHRRRGNGAHRGDAAPRPA